MWDSQKAEKLEKLTGHCVFGPSQAARFMACPASVSSGLDYPPAPPSQYALEGTYLHQVMETLCLHGEERMKDDYPSLYVYDSEKLQWVKSAYAYLSTILDTAKDPVIKVEETGNLESWGVPEVWGTADVVVLDGPNGVLHVIDWKFGKGIFVSSTDNPQLRCYGGIAAGRSSGFSKVRMHIVQPPLDNYSHSEISYRDLSQWIQGDLKRAIECAKSDDPEYGPSVSTCRWCPHKPNCKPRYDSLTQAAQDVFAHILADHVPPEDWADLYTKVCELKNLKADLEEQFKSTIKSGGSIPGYKFVSGRLSRKYRDVASVESYVEAHNLAAHKRTLITPAQFQKKWPERYADIKYAIEESRTPTIVPESDKREALKPEDL